MDQRNPTVQSDSNDRTLHIPQRQFVAPPQPSHDANDPQKRAATEAVRQQIDRIYNASPPNTPQQQNQPVQQTQQTPNPYARTHDANFDWRKYHTAWQQYYQQYYQRYYWQQLHAERQKLATAAADAAVKKDEATADNTVSAAPTPEAPVPAKSRVEQLRADITNKVKERAEKLRHSHHFMPVLSALGVGLAFIFLQFNSVVFAQIQSYISPGALSGNALSINPAAPINVGPEPKLIIPKISVEVPIDFNVASLSEAQIQQSLRDGATHYKLPGANALPGQNGNTVILGHSSNDIFNQGTYKFVFVLLDRLQPGDVFHIHYNGTRYTYRMTESKVIDPTDFAALRLGNDKPMATLVTCTPPGTALKRLLIYGEQINPDPAAATTATETVEPAQQEAALPGNEPTILDQIWSFFF